VFSSPPPAPVPRQTNPITILKQYLPEIRFNSILTSILGCRLHSLVRSSEWNPPLRLSNKNFVRISHLPIDVTCPIHITIVDMFMDITFGKQ
jgi:hypothetical protein